MADERWVIVPNWDTFQHYSDRDPTWIKLYVALNGNPDWRVLTDAEKGWLCTCWIEYAYSHGQIRVCDVPSNVRPARLRCTVERLSEAGFIELSASRPLAIARAREKKSSREEKDARALAAGSAAHALEDNGATPEPPRDPEALAKIKALADRIGNE